MPELPEVECLTNAIRSQILGATILQSHFLRKDLRDPIPIAKIKDILANKIIQGVNRRSKYMLWHTDSGICGFHLGMTGNILLMDKAVPQVKHTHAVFTVKNKQKKIFYLHFIDPRRFGRIFACDLNQEVEHKFFKFLGPEPLQLKDLGTHLYALSRKKKTSIKSFIMDQNIVVGVGNIYASEALFKAKTHPHKKASAVSKTAFMKLAQCIKETLQDAIKAGGTSFRDFKNSDGSPGYFEQSLLVYGRKGKPCKRCKNTIQESRISGRSTFFCLSCQKDRANR